MPHRPNTRGTDAREPNDYKGKGAIAQASLHGFDLLTIQAGLCASLNMRDRLWSVQEGGQDGPPGADGRQCAVETTLALASPTNPLIFLPYDVGEFKKVSATEGLEVCKIKRL